MGITVLTRGAVAAVKGQRRGGSVGLDRLVSGAGVVWAIASCAVSLPFAGAQAQTHVLRGIVSDNESHPIAGAEVSIAGTSLRAVTDLRGQFSFSEPPPGQYTLNVRRLGFRPTIVSGVIAGSGDAVQKISLTSLPQVLAPIVVQQTNPHFTGRLAGFYERLHRKSGGYYVTQEEIDRENPRSLTGVLRRFPAVTLFRDRGGATGIRFRGRACRPLVWLDGFPMPAGEVDLDSFSPRSLHGVELYLGFTSPPARYLSSVEASRCGTILLWSRGPDTDPRFASREVKPAPDLSGLPGHIEVFTADQVDNPAALAAGRADVVYPAVLLAQRLSGRVVVGFVIDTTGRVEEETVGVISASHPMFAESVREALREWTFVPATRQGITVRQWANQTFTFSPEAEGRKKGSRNRAGEGG